MTHDIDPSQNPGPTDWEILLRAITKTYEKDFEEAPARAAAAKQTAIEVVAEVTAGLEAFGFPLDILRDGITEHGDELQRVLTWAAFDYSVERSDGNVDVPDPQVISALPALALHTHEADFGEACSFTQQTIIAMRMYRHETGAGPITDPSQNFADDFVTVAEVPPPF